VHSMLALDGGLKQQWRMSNSSSFPIRVSARCLKRYGLVSLDICMFMSLLVFKADFLGGPVSETHATWVIGERQKDGACR
jgi:hypothetical protein